eukprot:3874834-Prymnesium_polylepis.2
MTGVLARVTPSNAEAPRKSLGHWRQVACGCVCARGLTVIGSRDRLVGSVGPVRMTRTVR